VPLLVVVAFGSTVVVPPVASPLSLVAFLEEQLINIPAANRVASAVSLMICNFFMIGKLWFE
jgi:hypothetical protein